MDREAICPKFASGRVIKEGDWSCASCGNLNFAKRTKCNVCSLPRTGPNSGGTPSNISFPQAAPSSSASSSTLSAAAALRKDWACTHCGNVNWARREKCNMCDASKPAGGEEPRTGRGGGHFDLQDPYDKSSHDSDTEDFDEFGRKKKKKENHSRPETDMPKLAVVSASSGRTVSPTSQAISNAGSSDQQRRMAFPPAPSTTRTRDDSSPDQRAGPSASASRSPPTLRSSFKGSPSHRNSIRARSRSPGWRGRSPPRRRFYGDSSQYRE